MEPGIIYGEWTEECEDGVLGYQLVLDDGDPLIYMREQDEDGQWSEWEEEDLDGAGESLLKRLPAILAAERVQVRRELLEEIEVLFNASVGLGSPGAVRFYVKKDLLAALDRICPEKE